MCGVVKVWYVTRRERCKLGLRLWPLGRRYLQVRVSRAQSLHVTGSLPFWSTQLVLTLATARIVAAGIPIPLLEPVEAETTLTEEKMAVIVLKVTEAGFAQQDGLERHVHRARRFEGAFRPGAVKRAEVSPGSLCPKQ